MYYSNKERNEMNRASNKHLPVVHSPIKFVFYHVLELLLHLSKMLAIVHIVALMLNRSTVILNWKNVKGFYD